MKALSCVSLVKGHVKSILARLPSLLISISASSPAGKLRKRRCHLGGFRRRGVSNCTQIETGKSLGAC